MRYYFHRPRCWCDKYPSNILEFRQATIIILPEPRGEHHSNSDSDGPTVLKGMSCLTKEYSRTALSRTQTVLALLGNFCVRTHPITW